MTVKINDKAVSEAIGFILILGLVLTGIALVTLYGYPVLVKEQSSTDVKNMERAMIVIQKRYEESLLQERALQGVNTAGERGDTWR